MGCLATKERKQKGEGKRVREKETSQEGEETRSPDKGADPKQAKDPEAQQLLLLPVSERRNDEEKKVKKTQQIEEMGVLKEGREETLWFESCIKLIFH